MAKTVAIYEDTPNGRFRLGVFTPRNATSVRHIGEQIRQRHPNISGIKTTALFEASVRDRLYSADSMAWSYHARQHGRSSSDWREAAAFVQRIETMPVQLSLL